MPEAGEMGDHLAEPAPAVDLDKGIGNLADLAAIGDKGQAVAQQETRPPVVGAHAVEDKAVDPPPARPTFVDRLFVLLGGHADQEVEPVACGLVAEAGDELAEVRVGRWSTGTCSFQVPRMSVRLHSGGASGGIWI